MQHVNCCAEHAMSHPQAVGSCELNSLVRQPLAGSDSGTMMRVALLKVRARWCFAGDICSLHFVGMRP